MGDIKRAECEITHPARPGSPSSMGLAACGCLGGTLKPLGSCPNNFEGLGRETHRQLEGGCWLCACLPSWCGFSAASELPCEQLLLVGR